MSKMESLLLAGSRVTEPKDEKERKKSLALRISIEKPGNIATQKEGCGRSNLSLQSICDSRSG